MLKILRDKKNAKMIWIILTILILPAFLLWGTGSSTRNKYRGEAGFAGKVSGKQVPMLEFQNALEATRNYAVIQFGDNLSEIQKYIDFESQAWERIILLAEAKRRKITSGDKEVIEAVKTYPIFQRDGLFNNQMYQWMLRYAFNTQARIFEEQIRQNVILSKLYKEITDGVIISENEIKKEYEKNNEQISLSYIAAIPYDFIDKNAVIEGKELNDYFRDNKLEFKQPFSFNLEYISADSVEKIQNLLQYIDKKEKLTEAVKGLGLSVKETGLFAENAPIPGIGWSPQVINLITKAKTGVYLSPIQIDKSYYLFMLKERKEPFIPEYDTIKDKVKEKFLKHKSEESAKTKIEECLKKLREDYTKGPKGIDFTNTAKLFGLKAESTNLFKYNSYIEGIGSSDNLWAEAKKLKENEFSGIISLPSGFYIIKLKSFVPIDEKKFKEEKPELSRRLLTQKKQEFFNTFTEGLKAKSQRYR